MRCSFASICMTLSVPRLPQYLLLYLPRLFSNISSQGPFLPALHNTTSPVHPSLPLCDFFQNTYHCLTLYCIYLCVLPAFLKKKINLQKARTSLYSLLHSQYLKQCLEHNGHSADIFKLMIMFRIDHMQTRISLFVLGCEPSSH